jgi:predicted porin
MKKHLIAAAVAAAVAVPAAAQVTVYGILDVSAASASKVAVAKTTVTATGYAEAATEEISKQRVDSNYWATSRLGFRGEEDLGGGLKAVFTLEGALSPDAGNASTPNLQDRLSFVGLQGAFGTIRIGQVAADINTAATAHGVGNFANLATRTDTRPNNSIDYVSPAFSGISLRITHSAGAASESISASNKKNGELQSIGLSGKIGGLSVLLVSAEQKVKTSATTAATWDPNTAISAGSTHVRDIKVVTNAAQDGKFKDNAVLVGYNLGFANVTAQYLTSKSEGTVLRSRGATGDIDDKTWAITAVAPVGGGLNIIGNYSSTDNKTEANKDSKRFSVGVDKALSKRTSAYAVYTKTDNQTSGTAGGAVAGSDPTTTAIGVRHTF